MRQPLPSWFALTGLLVGPSAAYAGLPLPGTAAWQWLATPISGAAEHAIGSQVAWHGRLMVLSWGVLIPLGVLVARFLKVTPWQDWPRERDNKFWWHGHRLLQWSAMALMSAALVLIWGQAGGLSPAARLHGWLGWAMALLGWLQVAGGYLRGSKGGPLDENTQEVRASTHWRGDHYDMTPRRRAFERVHKGLGYAGLALACLVLLLGLAVADAPRWMWLALALWWLLWCALFALLQRGGWCIDTYQAIWGPGQTHPGNRLSPIGWGIRRHTRRSIRRRSLLRCWPARNPQARHYPSQQEKK